MALRVARTCLRFFSDLLILKDPQEMQRPVVFMSLSARISLARCSQTLQAITLQRTPRQNTADENVAGPHHSSPNYCSSPSQPLLRSGSSVCRRSVAFTSLLVTEKLFVLGCSPRAPPPLSASRRTYRRSSRKPNVAMHARPSLHVSPCLCRNDQLLVRERIPKAGEDQSGRGWAVVALRKK